MACNAGHDQGGEYHDRHIGVDDPQAEVLVCRHGRTGSDRGCRAVPEGRPGSRRERRAPARTAGVRRGGRRTRPGGCAGQRRVRWRWSLVFSCQVEKRVVKAGVGDPELVGGDVPLGEQGDHGVDGVVGAVDADQAVLLGDGGDGGQRGQVALRESARDGVKDMTVAPTVRPISPLGVSSAATRPLSMTAIRSQSRWASSMKWVTSSDGHARCRGPPR